MTDDLYKGIEEMFISVEDPLERARLIKNERNRRWKRANREKVLAARKRYCMKYPEKIKKENERFRTNNPDYKKEYYQTHKKEASEWHKNRTEEQRKIKAEYNRKWKNERYANDIGYIDSSTKIAYK